MRFALHRARTADPFVSTFFFLSVYGQVALRLSALDTGLLFLKFFLGFVILSLIWFMTRPRQ